jgi:hypothetical protein
MSAGFPKIQRRRSGDSWAVAKFPAKSAFPAGSHRDYVEDCPVYAGRTPKATRGSEGIDMTPIFKAQEPRRLSTRGNAGRR